MKRLFAEHRSGARDHGSRIWQLRNLELWLRVCVDRDADTGFAAPTKGLSRSNESRLFKACFAAHGDTGWQRGLL